MLVLGPTIQTALGPFSSQGRRRSWTKRSVGRTRSHIFGSVVPYLPMPAAYHQAGLVNIATTNDVITLTVFSWVYCLFCLPPTLLKILLTCEERRLPVRKW